MKNKEIISSMTLSENTDKKMLAYSEHLKITVSDYMAKP